MTPILLKISAIWKLKKVRITNVLVNFYQFTPNQISRCTLFSGIQVVTLRCLSPIFQMIVWCFSFFCIWHLTRVCCHYPNEISFPMKHIWISSPQIFEWSPSIYLWPSQWHNCSFLEHLNPPWKLCLAINRFLHLILDKLYRLGFLHAL